MDWSSVYEENGDESGNFDRMDDIAASVRTSILDSLQVYNPYVCYAFTVNYILGVGCLGIPYAFYQSGIILGSVLIMFLSFISYTAVMWIAETSHRGMQLRLDSNSKNPFRSPKLMKRKKSSARRAVIGKTSCIVNFEEIALQPTIFKSMQESIFSCQQVGSSYGTATVIGVGSKRGGRGNSGSSGVRTVLNLQTDKESLTKSRDDKDVHRSVTNLYSSISQLTSDREIDIPGNFQEESVRRISNLINNQSQIQDKQYGRHQSSSQSQSKSHLLHPDGFLDSTNRFIARGRSNTTDEADADSLEFSELEVTELTLDILGPRGFILYQVALVVLTYVGLLAYTQVFVQSFISQIWPAAPAFLPNVLFGCVVIPLSCFDLAEQITVQVLMSLLRFVSLGTLLGVTLMAISQNKSVTDIGYHSTLQLNRYPNLIPGDNDYTDSQLNLSLYPHNVPLCNFSGFGVMFTTAIFR